MDRTVPVGAALLLDFVYRTDAGSPPPKCYETIFGNRQNHLSKPITQMTLGELIDAQKDWSSKAWVRANWKVGPAASSAAGAAQFMRDTLIGLSKELGLSGSQYFDANLQDRLAYHLLKRRGYEDYIAGKIDATEFGKRLAMEWASFPVLSPCQGAHRKLKRGQSYYAGDAVNKALVSPSEVEEVLLTIRKAPDRPKPVPAPQKPPVDAAKTAGVPIPPKTPEPQPAPSSGGKSVAAGAAGILVLTAAFWTWALDGWHHLVSIIQGAF
jgi:muramidase (phage lysozyme)